MIEFVSLFLGLVSGPQAVDLLVEGEVAAVELRLDGEAVARLAEPPWTATIDFGTALRPRTLAAVAFDSDGEELARASQELNRPRPPAEARAVLERDGSGRVTHVRLAWESLEGRYPLRTRATLDGTPLVVLDPARIELPPVDPKGFHVLSARLEFAGGVVAEARAAFGGGYVETVGTELTAVPIALEGKEPSLRRLEGWFEVGGQRPRVLGVEKGIARLIVVRGEGVLEAVEALEGAAPSGLGGGGAVSGATGMISMGQATAGSTASVAERRRGALSLGDDVRYQLLLPFAQKRDRRRLDLELFAASPEIDESSGGLLWTLGQAVFLPDLEPTARLADALAVAGLRAASEGRRRAVVLVTTGDTGADGSRYAADTVRGYLQSMGVPLYVWRIGEANEAAGPWPEDATIADYRDLARAARELERDLERQRVVWLEGTFPAERVRLTTAARARRLGG